MSGGPPPNVARLIKLNDQHANAVQHAQSLSRGNATGKWHEKDLHNQGKRDTSSIRNTDFSTMQPSTSSAATQTSATAKIAGELHAGREALLVQRRARLQELYAQETKMYEEQLNSMGMALTKPRQ